MPCNEQPPGHGRTDWRGRVQHVGSGEARYFREWSTRVAFREAMLPRASGQGTGLEGVEDAKREQWTRISGVS
jgi:hypothetical protein